MDNANAKRTFSYLALVLVAPLLVLMFFLADGLLCGLTAALLVILAVLLGIAVRKSAVVRTPPAAQLDPSGPVGQARFDQHCLWPLLSELGRMQTSDDLLERYQYFLGIVEKCLEAALGPCTVSLWCPDPNYEYLVECVINSDAPRHSWSRAVWALPHDQRDPCRVPLDSPEILNALHTTRPYLAEHFVSPSVSRQLSSATLNCDACIPLYRNYGLPLLICAECAPPVGPPERLGELDFNNAVDLITLTWNLLQAANQRQWLISHEQASRVLRADAFVRQGQLMADRAGKRDELFCVVVLTIRGFRGMFAGRSRQWQDLADLLGRCLADSLRQKERPFLLGRMADDVFCLLLCDCDEFLADATMKQLTQQMDQQVPRSPRLRQLDIMAIEMQWTLADHRDYDGSFQKMLDRIYRRLFDRTDGSERYSHRILLQPETLLVKD